MHLKYEFNVMSHLNQADVDTDSIISTLIRTEAFQKFIALTSWLFCYFPVYAVSLDFAGHSVRICHCLAHLHQSPLSSALPLQNVIDDASCEHKQNPIKSDQSHRHYW